ncbi:PhoH family protein [Lactiplantibacillus plantarum]|uniref:PhoH family protein n=1 Tax=Lactiplantibacillus plantarum TaxID=1590 RepID=UPI00077E3097|nr:PhoH family protein [Lactiplantibacillus plantarum]AMR19809.2 phosphate starvation-inducible protein PhoH [Lactiplantibacillus plantarum]MDN7028922.1 PhoH family protein [Lactiplantibacillus plantarum]QIA84487.1 PhoH family protein [Lactiplantibacillus plantarum]QTL12319.1 PhoH family protein [Lactiplantibacillus plantarum]QVG74948.1 PhoH family protein [Lactiplantibacillus plantarum]
MFLTENSKYEQKFLIADPAQSVALLGPEDAHLALIEDGLHVQLHVFGDQMTISSDDEVAVHNTQAVLDNLTSLIKQGIQIGAPDVISAIKMVNRGTLDYFKDLYSETLIKDNRGRPIRVKNFGQRQYVQAVAKSDITFGIGPAGTGKTYLAVVMAIAALKRGDVEKLILTRPAVEAGESLGFLPGDLKEKVDPYLRPIYDALYDIYGAEHTQRLMDRGIIEIAPLAYMRGRTLDHAFVILDEAQNTTNAQMKMFLTRLGFGAKMIVNGDISQIDLPHHTKSGLIQAKQILGGISNVAFVKFTADDVVRNPVVAKIITAYDRVEQR